MKKIYVLLLLSIASFLIGCSLINTTVETNTTEPTTESVTTESVTTVEDTTSSSTTTSTNTTGFLSTDLSSIFDDEIAYLSSMVPNEITEDWSLPSVLDSRFSAIFYQDELLIDNGIFTYTPSLDGIQSILKIVLSYGSYSETINFTILMTENETLYNQLLIEQTFNQIDQFIAENIPEAIEADLYLPEIDMDNVSLTYEIDTSYVYNDYFIFPFPTENSVLNMTITIRFQGITQIRNLPIIMKGFDSLFKTPEIRINTENQTIIDSKEVYVLGTFSLITYDTFNNPIPLLNNANMQIRCRGNSTFYMPKLSYRVKFESKTNLLFDYYEKDWVLLANFSDQTLIRNYLAHNLSSDMEMEFSPAAAFVDVFINDEYMGNYMLSDQIEVSNDRVNIDEHSFDVDTGYLLEMDKRQDTLELREGVEGVDFFYVYGVPYVIKSPKTDSIYYSHAQFVFIESYIATVHLALMNHQDYDDLIDEESFIDWFIIQELFQNVDSGYSSVYMYKDTDSLLKMGPIWDFDLSAGNPGHLGDDLRKPEGWYTSLVFKNIWYYYLMQYDDFRLHLKERWNEVYGQQIQSMLRNVYEAANSIARSRYLNFQRWDIIGKWEDWYTAPEVLAADTYEKQVEFLYDFLYTRSIWLNEEINKF